MFGGRDGSPPGFTDTWEWDGANWMQRFPPSMPAYRLSPAMAYDPSTGVTVLFAGTNRNDTWTYRPTNAAGFRLLGAGCAGSFGVAAIAADPGVLPWLGDSFSARITGLGPSPTRNAPVLFLGDSKTFWGTVGLPMNLAIVGMPGCLLYTNPVVSMPLVNAGGTAAWSLRIPNLSVYAGGSVFVQAAALDAPANAAGVTMSNAYEMKIGSR